MNLKERNQLINTYKDQFNHCLLSNHSEIETIRLQAQKDIMSLFFTEKEITDIENSVRVTSPYIKEYFEVVESWTKQVNKEVGEKEMYFSWDKEGLNKVNNHYDWLFTEYKGFKLAIENAMNLMDRVG